MTIASPNAQAPSEVTLASSLMANGAGRAEIGSVSRKRPVQGIVGGVLIALVVIPTVLASWIAPSNPDSQNLLEILKAPALSWNGLLGTDQLGRSMVSRVLYGGRIALGVTVVAVLASAVFGISLGILSGFARGWLDSVLGRLADMQLALPSILLAIVVLAFAGSGLVPLTIMLAIITWPLHYRIVRAHVLSLSSRQFVEAARISGANRRGVIRRHLLPNVLPLAAITCTLSFSTTLLLESSLGFLGLGIQPPTADWGAMVAAGQSQLGAAWWLSVCPGVVLVVLLLGVQLLGDTLADRLSVDGLTGRPSR